MKKIVFTILVLSNCGIALAQDCIPNPVNYSMGIVAKLRYNLKDSFANNIITWNDIAPLYDNILNDSKKTDSVPSKESAKNDIEVKLVARLYENLDTILARGQRFGIRWNKISFKNDASRITKEKDLPASLWFDDGKLQFNSGDSVYELSCQALLVNGNWKLAGISPEIYVYDKSGVSLGSITYSYIDFEKDTAAYVDTAMVASKQLVTKKKKTPIKKKTISIAKQAIKKPDTN